MKLTEAQALRSMLTQEIGETIERFETRTGCEVIAVQIDRTPSIISGGRRRSLLNSVRLTVELGAGNPEDVLDSEADTIL